MKKLPILSFINIRRLSVKKEDFKNLFWFLGANIFYVILFFVLIEILFGGFLFYEYVVLRKQQVPEIKDTTLKFQDSAYLSVFDKLDAREKEFNSPLQEGLLDPFQAE